MYGLIGNPLGHSFSADFFNKKFENEGINESYMLFPLPEINCVESLINDHKDLKGFNVTIPYKQQIIPYLTSLSDEAEEIGAVNVVKVERNHEKTILRGYNSDAIGFRNSILPLLKPNMKKALVLGTGGASKAVVYALKSLGINVTRVSRKASEDAISYENLTPGIMAENLIIVNTTPLGMWPNVDDAPAIPYHLVSSDHLCYDVVYNPEMTTFMAKSKNQGAVVKNGLEMLYLQALAAWEIWQS